MGEILAGLRAARLEAAGDPAAGDAKVQLWQMARNHIAAARNQAVLDKGVQPWTPQQTNDRVTAHTSYILASARRALALVAHVPRDELRRLRDAGNLTLT